MSTEVLSAYARAVGGIPVFAGLLLLYILTELVRVSSSVWLSIWTEGGGDNGGHGGCGGSSGDGAAEGLLGHWRSGPGVASVEQHKVGSSRSPMFFLGVFCAISFTQVRITFTLQSQGERTLYTRVLPSVLSTDPSHAIQTAYSTVYNGCEASQKHATFETTVTIGMDVRC